MIVHICQLGAWQAAQARGEYCPPSLDDEGFIHCSKPEQVLHVAKRFYRDVPDLILLWIDTEKVRPEIRWEEADGEVFPHIYGALNTDAVVSVSELGPGMDLNPPF